MARQTTLTTDPIINGVKLGLDALGCQTKMVRVDKNGRICKGGRTTHEELHIYLGKKWVYILTIVPDGCYIEPGYHAMCADGYRTVSSKGFIVPLDHPNAFAHIKHAIHRHVSGTGSRKIRASKALAIIEENRATGRPAFAGLGRFLVKYRQRPLP